MIGCRMKRSSSGYDKEVIIHADQSKCERESGDPCQQCGSGQSTGESGNKRTGEAEEKYHFHGGSER